MLKSSAPAAVVEQDPLEYYEQHTAQIEVALLIEWPVTGVWAEPV